MRLKKLFNMTTKEISKVKLSKYNYYKLTSSIAIDLDAYMNLILNTYKMLKVTTRKNLEELFKAADV